MANDPVALGVVDDPEDVDKHDRRSLRWQIRSSRLLGLDSRGTSSDLHSIPISLKRRMSLSCILARTLRFDSDSRLAFSGFRRWLIRE
jgi:hypothetical protein